MPTLPCFDQHRAPCLEHALVPFPACRMRLSTWLSTFVIVWCSATPGECAEAWSGKLFVGVDEADDIDFPVDAGRVVSELDAGLTWGLTVGYQFETLRLEGEILTSRSHDVASQRLNGGSRLAASSGKVESEAGIANLLFDLRREASVSPYLGFGLGVAEIELNELTAGGLVLISDEANVLAYRALAGVGIDLSDRLALDFDLRYYATGDAEVTATPEAGLLTSDVSYSAFSVTIGLRYDL